MIIDCQLVEFLKNEILSQPTNIPSEFIMCIVMLLNRGSVLPTSSAVSNYHYVSDGMYCPFNYLYILCINNWYCNIV